jgi:hypothetical protein
MKAEQLKLDPCPECPIPMNVLIKPLAVKEGECQSFGISCRECGEKWTEEIEG